MMEILRSCRFPRVDLLQDRRICGSGWFDVYLDPSSNG